MSAPSPHSTPWVFDASRRQVPVRGRPLADFKGLAIALGIITAWVGSVGFCLATPTLPWPAWVVLVALNTLLGTGLFITAHDAIHGTVVPGARTLNAAIGQLALGLYAGFSFEPLRAAHQQHHLAPASALDPDYHDGRRTGFWRWYLHFLVRYITVGQVLRLAVVFNILVHLLGVSELRCLVFWVLPMLLSTAQLFYFGTYRTHREPPAGYVDAHRATSNDLPVWLSFVTCFHFGYHHEHHANSGVPWWRLPAERARARREHA